MLENKIYEQISAGELATMFDEAIQDWIDLMGDNEARMTKQRSKNISDFFFLRNVFSAEQKKLLQQS